MATSPDLNLIKLRWAGNYLDGSPCAGTVELQYIGPPMLDEDTDFPVAVYPSKIVLTLAPTEITVQDKDGSDVLLTVGYAELDVPASNDPDLIGSGGVYRLNERIHKGGGRADIDFAVDVDTPGGELWLNRVSGGEVGNPEIPSPVYWRDLNALAQELDDLEAAPVKGHTQPIGTITGLEAALAGKQPAGSYVVTTDTRLSDARTPLTHSHSWESITGKPNTFPATTHGHTIANVTGLQSSLDGKAPVVHSHAISDVDGLQDALDAAGAGGGPSGPTAWADITDKPTEFPAEDHLHDIADVTGLQTALDGKQASGDYATNTALTNGLAGKANTSHTHSISSTTGLQDALDAKQASGDYVEEGDARLTDARTPTAHTHAWPDITGKPSTFAPATHSHTISDTTGLQAALDGKQASGSYATSSDLTTGLAGKANTSHTHTIANTTGLQAALDAKGTSNLTLGTSGSTAKAGDYTPPVADLPAGITLTVYYTGSAWPARPTARTDVTVQWVGGSEATPPPGESATDLWFLDVL